MTRNWMKAGIGAERAPHNQFRLGARKRTEPIERFKAKFVIDLDTGCWLWTASKRPNGYAQFNDGVSKGMVHAHIWSYRRFVGQVPPGLELDHTCRVRHCVNPDHLDPVTHSVNLKRGFVGRANARKTHCPKGHPYDEQNTRTGTMARRVRRCRTCERSYPSKRHITKRKALSL